MIGKSRCFIAVASLVCAVASAGGPAIASETIVYTYDALGRLVRSERSGSVNNGIVTEITHDDADNRVNYRVTASPDQLILSESFEGAVPEVGQKDDGGWVVPAQVTGNAFRGSRSLRLGMVGSHVFRFNALTFTAAQSTVTISVRVRDSGVSNLSLTGWSGSSEDAAHPIMVGLYNNTSGSWAIDGWPGPPRQAPPNGGAWVVDQKTISGLVTGNSYALDIGVDSYFGNRAVDIDSLQVEYGVMATPPP